MILMIIQPWLRTLPLALIAVLSASCSSDAGTDKSPSADVVTSFYAVEYLSERIFEGSASVANLTPTGADAHDLELKPSSLTAISDAKLAIHLGGFQSAFDEALSTVPGPSIVDLKPHVESAERPDDPHFWLDPQRMISAAQLISQEGQEVFPDDSAEIQANTDELIRELTELDETFRTTLDECQSSTLITSHDAFGFLADAYGLSPFSAAGIEPSQEATPAALSKLVEVIRSSGTSTVFSEDLSPNDLIDTVATETGTERKTLSTIEGRTQAQVEAGADYRDLMASNLQAISQGLGCDG